MFISSLNRDKNHKLYLICFLNISSGSLIYKFFSLFRVKSKVVNILDHSQIEKDVEWFKDKQPSSENLLLWIWQELCDDIKDCKLHRIRLVETHSIHNDYYGP